jgi:hypothetical protein
MKINFLPRLLAVAAVTLSVASAAAAAPHGILWAQGARPSPVGSAAVQNLRYYGGPVISHAKVYAIFWGDNVDPETTSKIGPFYANMLDSTYMDWLAEYNTNLTAVDGRQGTNQTIGRGSFAGALTIQPANTETALTDAMVQAELDAQIAAAKLPGASADNLYMVYFPSGISISIEGLRSCSSFCAYHEGFKSARDGASIYYGIMPVCGFGCGMGGSKFAGTTIVSSHECIEAITDPFPTPGDKPAYPQAWNTSRGDEIGDLCASGSSTVTGHGLTSSVQWEWDNATSACAQGPWTQSAVPALPLLATLRAGTAGVWSSR